MSDKLTIKEIDALMACEFAATGRFFSESGQP